MCGNNNNSRRASKHLVKTLQISTCTQLGVLEGCHLVREADISAAELSITTRLQNKDRPFLSTVKHSERNHHLAPFFLFVCWFVCTQSLLSMVSQEGSIIWKVTGIISTRGRPQRHFLTSCADSLWPQKYVPMLSCGRKNNNNGNLKRRKYQPGVYRTCQMFVSGMKTCQRFYVTPWTSHLKWYKLLCLPSIYLLPFFFWILCSHQHKARSVSAFLESWEKLPDMPTGGSVVQEKGRGISLHPSPPPPTPLLAWRKMGRVCSLLSGSGELTSDSADALGISNSFRILVIFIGVRNPTAPSLWPRWGRHLANGDTEFCFQFTQMLKK